MKNLNTHGVQSSSLVHCTFSIVQQRNKAYFTAFNPGVRYNNFTVGI